MKKLAITFCILFISCYTISIKADIVNIENQTNLSLTDQKGDDDEADDEIHPYSIVFTETPKKINKETRR